MQGFECLTGEYGMRGTRPDARAGRPGCTAGRAAPGRITAAPRAGATRRACRPYRTAAFSVPDGQRAAPSWPTSVIRTTAAPASSEAARSISALMPQS